MKTIRDHLLSMILRSRNSPRLQDLSIAFYNLFYPLPYEEPTMEFTQGIWAGISSIRCVEGRQIGETNSLPAALYRPVPTQFHQGNLEGSRAGYSINLTALQHIMRLWPDLLSFIGFIRQLTMQRLGITRRNLTTIEMYLVGFVGISVPAYMARRKLDQKVDMEITLIVADQQKLIAGVFMMVRHMLERGNLDLTETTQLTGAELFDYCDEHGLFLAPTGAKTACGGAKRKIIELIDHVINGSNKELVITDAAQESINQLGNLQEFMDYALAAIEIELSTMLSRAAIKNYLFNSGDYTNPAIENNILASQWKRVRDHLASQSCSNSNLSHQISTLYWILSFIKASGHEAWFDLCNSDKNSGLNHLPTVYLALCDYFQTKQRGVLRILGFTDKEKSVIFHPRDINQKIDVLPACVFNEIMKNIKSKYG